MKLAVRRLAAVLGCLVIVMVGLTGCGKKSTDSSLAGIKNVIIMIGDGFGPNHLTNAKRYFGIERFAYEDDYLCDVTTYSLNASVTDSAAAATALATGRKVDNGEVGWHQAKDIQNIMELATANGKKTGILTSDTLNGATPACYSAHAANRYLIDEIIRDQMQSGIDIFVGAQGNGTYRQTPYAEGFVEQGYTLLENPVQLKTLNRDQKYLATFPSLQSLYDTSVTNQVDYPDVITDVLNYLDNPKGFCLMIENAYIDKNSHANNFHAAMCEVLYFADMIEAVYQFCAERDDTVVLITADHETGGLQLGSERQDFNDALYTSWDHSGADVHLYLKNATIPNHGRLNNTDIFKFCQKIVTK